MVFKKFKFPKRSNSLKKVQQINLIPLPKSQKSQILSYLGMDNLMIPPFLNYSHNLMILIKNIYKVPMKARAHKSNTYNKAKISSIKYITNQKSMRKNIKAAKTAFKVKVNLKMMKKNKRVNNLQINLKEQTGQQRICPNGCKIMSTLKQVTELTLKTIVKSEKLCANATMKL